MGNLDINHNINQFCKLPNWRYAGLVNGNVGVYFAINTSNTITVKVKGSLKPDTIYEVIATRGEYNYFTIPHSGNCLQLRSEDYRLSVALDTLVTEEVFSVFTIN